MRDFGFWVRIVAISQLFSIVLLNYGDGWLASDNPILTVRKRQAQVGAPPLPSSAPPELSQTEFWDAASGAKKHARDREAGDWGDEDAEEAEPADQETETEEPWLPAEDADGASQDADWGSGPEPVV